MYFARRLSLSPLLGPSPLLALAFLLVACGGDPEPRVYSEAAFHEQEAGPPGMASRSPASPSGAAAMPPMEAGTADLQVTWTVPMGWVKKDSGLGMRVGSFLAPSTEMAVTGEMDPEAVDISVVQLAGAAGGLKPNISRWMGQIGLIADPEGLEEIVKTAGRFKTRSGQEGHYVDLTERLSGDITQNLTIYGAVIATPGGTVFVKAMGERKRVLSNLPRIQEFCKSLHIRDSKK